MTIQEMVDKNLDLIRDTKGFEEHIISGIFKKHKMQVTINLVISLGNYLEYLHGLTWDNDEYFFSKMEEKYGVMPEYAIEGDMNEFTK